MILKRLGIAAASALALTVSLWCVFFAQPQALGLYYLCGVSVVTLLLTVVLRPAPVLDTAPQAAVPGTPTRTMLVARVFASLGAVAALAIALFLFDGAPRYHGAAWNLYISALILLGAAAITFPKSRPAGGPYLKIELAGLLLALIVGAFPRFYQLAELPYGVWYDDAQSTLVAMKILQDGSYRPVFVPDLGQAPALIFYLYAFMIKIVGLEPSAILPMRVGTTLLALCSIGTVWLLARELFGRWCGFFAALFLALMRWHLTFSRFGTIAITPTLFGALALFFFVRAFRRGTVQDAIWCGMSLGIGMQFYFAMFIVPVLIAISAAHRIIAEPRRFGRFAILLITVIVSVTMTYAPILQFAIQDWESFGKRMSTVAVAPSTEAGAPTFLQTIQKTATEHLRMFHFEGDGNGRHNLPGAKMLDSITGLFMAIGLLWCLLRSLKPDYGMLAGWFCGAISTGILSLPFESPQAARTTGVTGVLAILAALPLARIVERFLRGESRPRVFKTVTISILGAVLFSAVGYLNISFYFNEQLKYPASWSGYSTQETRVGYLLRDESDRADIYVPDKIDGGPTESLIAGGRRAKVFQGKIELPLDAGKKDAAVVTEVGQDSVERAILRLYPDATVEAVVPPPSELVPQPDPILKIIRIPRSNLERVVQWRIAISQNGSVVHEELTSANDWNWDDFKVAPPFRAVIEGVTRIDDFGNYRWTVTSGGEAKLSIDGELMARGVNEAKGESGLAKGAHSIRLEFSVEKPGTRSMLRVESPLSDGQSRPLSPAKMFNPAVAGGGLIGNYYRGNIADGNLAFQQIDSQVALYFHILPLSRPFSVRWSGRIYIPESGLYVFGTDSIDESELFLDGKSVVASTEGNKSSEGAVRLHKGWHPIQVDYQTRNNYSQVYLYWTPPGKGRELVPASVLRPPGPLGTLDLQDPTVPVIE